MTLIVAKRTEDDFAAALGAEWSFLTALCKVDGEPLKLEAYQLDFLRNRSRFRWVIKSRQVGYSFLLGLEALARCHLRGNYTSVIVSYNLEDSKEKILVARQIYEDMPLAFQKKLVSDSKTELAFASNGPQQNVSRIISNPNRAPRGKHGDVALDELAHYGADREVYRGSTALILRSRGQLTGCSTPLGRRGIFYEIATEAVRPYPHHTRQDVPWWHCRFFCRDVQAAIREAPDVSTEDRVRRFGKGAIEEQFDSLALEDFQQELECDFVDESYAFFPYDLLLPCTHDSVVAAEDASDIRNVKGRLVAGFDVGRTRDASELAVFEHRTDGLHCVMLKSFIKSPFAAQGVGTAALAQQAPHRATVHRQQRHRHELGGEPSSRVSPGGARSFHQCPQRAVGGRLQDPAATARGGLAQRPQASVADPQHQATCAAVGQGELRCRALYQKRAR